LQARYSVRGRHKPPRDRGWPGSIAPQRMYERAVATFRTAANPIMARLHAYIPSKAKARR